MSDLDDRVGRFGEDGQGLRQRTARGTVVNGAFLVGINALALLRGLIVAFFLTRQEYGVWGILVVCVATLAWFRQAGIGQKFVAQDEPDQEAEFQKALTMEFALACAFAAVGVIGIPLLAYAYDTPEAAIPGVVMALSLPAVALQAPLNVFYRRMDFVRQRRLQAVDPVVAFLVTVPLAASGVGYWSLVIGTVVGGYTGAAVALAASPYRPRPRWDPARVRGYARFSGPLIAAGGVTVLFGQVLIGVGEAEVGLAGVGAITLAGTITQFANRADQVVTSTIYPAICAVRDRVEVLRETFVKSNRLALVWGAPYGLGVALFASDLVRFGLGSEWEPAVVLLQATGVCAAVRQIGFNWDSFYRAREQTGPVGWVAAWASAAFLAFAVPLLIWKGLPGLAAGFLLVEAVTLSARSYFVRKLFPGFDMLRHAARALAPSAPAVAAVLLARLAAGEAERTELVAAAEVVAYVAITAAATALMERALVREVFGYLRRHQAA